MSILNLDDSVLLIIDIQDRLLNAVFNTGQVEKNAEAIAKAAEIFELPVLITEQYPKGLGETIPCIKNNISNAKYFEKTAFNALLVMDLASELKKLGRKQVILCGIETHICVHQTAEALLECGYEVHLVKDVCGSRTLDEYVTSLKYMRKNNVYIKSLEMVMFELLKDARHPAFKSIQSLIK